MRVDVARLLADLSLATQRAGSGRRNGSCPSADHHDRKASWVIVELGPKAGQHYCIGCGFGGGPVALVVAVLRVSSSEARRWLLTRQHELPPAGATATLAPKVKARPLFRLPVGSIPLGHRLPPTTPAHVARAVDLAMAYLAGRGVTAEEVRLHRMHVVPPGAPAYGARVIVPVFVGGVLVDIVARLYQPAGPSVPKALSGRREDGARKELSLWAYDLLDVEYPRVHVVEGVWGGLALRRLRVPNVTAACGSSWSDDRTGLLERWPEIVLIPDGDPAGAELERHASSLRFAHDVRVAELPLKGQPDTVAPDVALRAIERARGARLVAQGSPARIAPWRGKVASARW